MDFIAKLRAQNKDYTETDEGIEWIELSQNKGSNQNR